MSQSTKPISPLRQRMIEDMTLRKFSPRGAPGTRPRQRGPGRDARPGSAHRSAAAHA